MYRVNLQNNCTVTLKIDVFMATDNINYTLPSKGGSPGNPPNYIITTHKRKRGGFLIAIPLFTRVNKAPYVRSKITRKKVHDNYIYYVHSYLLHNTMNALKCRTLAT